MTGEGWDRLLCTSCLWGCCKPIVSGISSPAGTSGQPQDNRFLSCASRPGWSWGLPKTWRLDTTDWSVASWSTWRIFPSTRGGIVPGAGGAAMVTTDPADWNSRWKSAASHDT